MEAQDFIATKVDKTSTKVTPNGWSITTTIKKDAGSDKITSTKKFFDTKQEGLPAELGAWLQSGEVTVVHK